MTLKTLMSALALSILPGLAMAMCTGSMSHDQQAMSCSDGTVFDTEKGTCVPIVTG